MHKSPQQIIGNCVYTRLANSQLLYHSLQTQTLLHVQHPLFSAIIALQGAQLLSFTLTDAIDWLWLKPKQSFQQGQPILGGIPLCAPWFGQKHQPTHGFAQLLPWQLIAVAETQKQVTLTFAFSHPGNHLFAGAFTLQQSLTLSQKGISFELCWQNLSPQTQQGFSFAWHSYFACQDNLQNPATVSGLNGKLYYDNRQGLTQHLQQGSITANTALDRVFCYANEALQLNSAKALQISTSSCPSTIVWRPEAGDEIFGDNAYRNFLCVEKGSVFDNEFSLTPQQTLNATMRITC